MPNKKSPFKTGFLARGLSASIAGLRAGGALAIDTALHKTVLSNSEQTHSAFAEREAQRFAKELGKLKGTYVKTGQMMALFGEHFLPPVLTQALHTLANNTEPLAWSDLEPSVKASLGDRYKLLDINPQALAAASLAQVHTATIRATGETICLKIQYPNLSQVIDEDFDAVVRMLMLARWLNKGQELDEWLNTMREHLHNEIDYVREVTLMQETRRLLEKSDTSMHDIELRIAKVCPEFCTDQIIAMEYMQGKPLSEINIQELSLERRNNLSKAMLDLFFKEVYDWGLLQTDPNFGNFLIDLDSTSRKKPKDTLILLDFGSVMEMPAESLEHLRNMINGSQQQNQQQIIDGLFGLGWLKADASPEAQHLFSEFCMNLLEPLLPPDKLPPDFLNDQGEYCWSHSDLMQRAGKKGARNAASRHFSPPASDFVMIARKLTGVFTFIAMLEAEFNGHSIIKPYTE